MIIIIDTLRCYPTWLPWKSNISFHDFSVNYTSISRAFPVRHVWWQRVNKENTSSVRILSVKRHEWKYDILWIFRNPAPVDRWFVTFPIGKQPSFWSCRISSIHWRLGGYVSFYSILCGPKSDVPSSSCHDNHDGNVAMLRHKPGFLSPRIL